MQQAEKNLTEAGGDLTDIAIFHLEHYDGVSQGEPIRNVLRRVSYVGMRTWSLAPKSSSPSLHRMCSKRSALFANTTIGSLRIDLSLTIRARLASNRLSPLRRRSLKARSISTPETSRTTGISTHPGTERMMFLGSRLVGSDLRAWCRLWTDYGPLGSNMSISK